MNRLGIMAAGAAVLVVAGVGYTLLLDILGPAVTPSPSRTLLARGTFVAGYAVDIKAVRLGSSVEGRMIVSEGRPSFTVDLQCTRTTEDGVILIGGLTTETTTAVAPEGTYAGIVFMPGSPVRATIWSQRGGDATQARYPSCLAYLDDKLPERRWILGEDWLGPIEGAVDFGANVPTAPSGERLARGHLDPRDWGPVEFAAFREGSGVTGRMTIGDETGTIDELGYLKVDLQCARTTEDDLTMIGGSVTDGAGRRFSQFPEGTLAAVGLKRGSPVRTAILVGATPSMPGTESTDCLAYLDAWLTERRNNPNDEWSLGDGPDPVEFGP